MHAPDMMMFLNVAVAITCFALFWVTGNVAFQGWLEARQSLPDYKVEA